VDKFQPKYGPPIYKVVSPEQFGLSLDGPKPHEPKGWLFHSVKKEIDFKEVLDAEEELRSTRVNKSGKKKKKFVKSRVLLSNSLKLAR
jgi:hypothetical protein